MQLKGLNIAYSDAIVWKTVELWKDAGADVLKRDEAVGNVAAMLCKIQSEYVRGEYCKNIAKVLGMGKKDLESRMRVKEVKAEPDGNERLYQLPDGVDAEFFSEWGFYSMENGVRKTGYWFDMGREKRQLEVSNFVVRPLFHLYSTKKDENKRMIEVNNGYLRKTVEIQSAKMISVEAFSAELTMEGNFIFYGNKMHLVKLNHYWGDKFPMCYELTNLGWQREGFFAFSDRIFNGDLLPYDEYGIVYHKEQHYYSPGANTRKTRNRDEQQKYSADFQLRYKPAPVTVEMWARQIATVFDEHYITAIGAVGMALCRDLYLTFSNNFPLVYAYGERQSGKSEFILTIMRVFLNDAKMYNVNSGTDASFFTYVGRFANCFVGLNEFNDNTIRPEWFESIKGFFDVEGRKRNIDKYKMEEQQPNSMVGLAGQYLSTKDDNSVVSRSFLCNFQSKENRSQEEMNAFSQLNDWNMAGLNGMLVEFLKGRMELIDAGSLKDRFDNALAMLRTEFKTRELRWEDRVGRNYAMLYSACEWMGEKWKMPYSRVSLTEYCVKKMCDVVNIMHTTDVLMEWWQTMSSLADPSRGVLKQGWHYKIKHASELEIRHKTLGMMKLGVDSPRRVVMMRLEYCHREYEKETGRGRHMSMNKTSLANYMKNRDYWLGTRDGEWFGTDIITPQGQKKKVSTNTSVYVFDYDILEKMGVYLNYDKEQEEAENITPKKETDEDPFKTKEIKGELPF
jgi:DNA primase